eukprot:5673413-Pyramimonas_sp.AAC.1
MDLSGFPKLARARCSVPADVEVICTQGRGTLIDYVIASSGMTDFVHVSTYTQGPFKTHVCPKVCIQHEALEQFMWQRGKPLPFPNCPGPDLPWSQHFLEAAAQLGREGALPDVPGYLYTALVPHAQDKLNDKLTIIYRTWSRATEAMFESRAVAVDHSVSRVKRGEFLVF